MEQTRREFIRLCSLAGTAGLLGLWSTGCAEKEEDNNPTGPAPGATVSVNLADYPQLGAAGGVASINGTALGRPILLTRSSADNYHALDSRCTHQACTVGATTPTLNCPCHGSRFNLSGGVVNGPATRALTAFQITREGDTLTIHLA